MGNDERRSGKKLAEAARAWAGGGRRGSVRAGNPAEVFKNLRQQAWEGGEKASDLLWLEYGVEEVGDIWDESRWPEEIVLLKSFAEGR